MYISYWVSKQALDTEIYDSNIYNMRNQANYEKLSAKEYYYILFYDKRFLQINRIHLNYS